MRSTGRNTRPLNRPSTSRATRTRKKYLQVERILLTILSKREFSIYLKMKSNCEKASMATPSRVETAPWVTGANMCSSASSVLLVLSPRLPTKLWKWKASKFQKSLCGL